MPTKVKGRGGQGDEERAANWVSVEWCCVIEFAWLARLWPLSRLCLKGRSHSLLELAVRWEMARAACPCLGMERNTILSVVVLRFRLWLPFVTHNIITIT